MCKKNIHCLAL